jgi:Spy/CpxP family protein refolding chaperone
MTTQRTLTLFAVLALAATPLSAQQHEHGDQDGKPAMGQMMGGDMNMMSMMTMMQTTPAALLRNADDMGLDDSQRAALQEIEERFAGEHKDNMEEVESLHATAAETIAVDSPDWESYEATLREAADHMVSAHVAMTRASFEAKAILTAEQLESIGHHMEMGKDAQMGEMDHRAPKDSRHHNHRR